jgi:hypothetical protein
MDHLLINLYNNTFHNKHALKTAGYSAVFLHILFRGSVEV